MPSLFLSGAGIQFHWRKPKQHNMIMSGVLPPRVNDYRAHSCLFPCLSSSSSSLSLYLQTPELSLRTIIIQQYLQTKMALMVNAASLLGVAQLPFPSLGLTSSSPRIPSSNSFKSPLLIHGAKTRPVFPPVFALKNRYDSEVAVDIVVEEEEDEAETVTEKPRTETLLYSFTPLPLLFVAALPGGNVNVNHPRKIHKQK